jgi:hypothetical protein
MRLSYAAGDGKRSPRLVHIATAFVVAALAIGGPVLASAPPAAAAGCLTCDDDPGGSGGGGGGGGGGIQEHKALWTKVGGLGPAFWITYEIDCLNDGGDYIEYGTTIFWYLGTLGWYTCWQVTP